jgi:hypothetical protein
MAKWSLSQLIQSTPKALPAVLETRTDPRLRVSRLSVTNFPELNIKAVRAEVTSVSRVPKRHKVMMNFQDMVDPTAEPASLAKTRVRLRCECEAFYFWFIYANKLHEALAGGDFPKYRRKTPPPPVGLPYKNPRNYPGMCKHLFALGKALRTAEELDD